MRTAALMSPRFRCVPAVTVNVKTVHNTQLPVCLFQEGS